ncbi:UNVERIFIED_CONTAM: hypothetical protein GTU68_031885 [Idotea baltica]|nr:hypothetical protein [Idotea baltica]
MHPAYEAIKPYLPEEAGVYRFFDKYGEVLYVGKAKNLKRRVSSYFTKTHDRRKTRLLVQNIYEAKYTVVDTEQEALLLESALIKKLQPRYNILLKDDKSYPYICIKKERFPRVFLTRRLIRDGSEYLGPFTSVRRVQNLLEFLENMYPLRTCNLKLTKANIDANKFKACLEYHIGNCKAPCVNNQTEEEYNDDIKNIRQILKGNFAPVKRELKSQIDEAVEKLEFEKAHILNKRFAMLQQHQSKNTVVNPKINNVDVFAFTDDERSAYVSFFKVVNGSIIQVKMVEVDKKIEEEKEDILPIVMVDIREQLQSTSKEIIIPFEVDYAEKGVKLTIPDAGDKKKLLELAFKNAMYYKKQRDAQKLEKSASQKQFEILTQIKKDFRLKDLPRHIECFDNSNFQGSYPVASMVCFRDAKPYKKDYRHYKIKTVVGPDDFASMTEVVGRRYKRLVDEGKSLPQLIVIDGGKGQLSAAVTALRELDLYGEIAIIGIAKRLEEIYFPGDSVPLYIDKKSHSLRIVQHLRNEAHRFAITYHRNLRSKGTFQSELEKISGVGKVSVTKLLSHFKSIKAIKEASITDLHQILNLKQAKSVKAYFEGKSDSYYKKNKI